MRWKRPHHTRWLVACVAAFLLAGNFGGFIVPVGAVFLIIFVVGAVLLNSDEAENVGAIDNAVDAPEAEPQARSDPDPADGTDPTDEPQAPETPRAP